MIRSHNLLDNRSIPAPGRARVAQPRRHASQAPVHTFTRTAQAPSAPRRAVATNALLTPEQAAAASQVLIQAATVAGGAAGMSLGRDISGRIKEQLALAALLMPRSSDAQRLDGVGARGAEAAYDIATVLAAGATGALLLHTLAQAAPIAQLAQL